MGLSVGIVGLPNVGKSTLFNAITNSQVEAANYPFATIKPNTGIVEVSDARLDFLCDLFKPVSRVAATIEFRDIAGLVKGASKGEGLGNQFLANIRETDAICHVVRCFEDPDIVHVANIVNSLDDVETINLELIFADLETVQNRIAKVEKKAKTTKEADAVAEYNLMVKFNDALINNMPARSVELSKEEELLARNYHLLTKKPIIYVGNIKESEISNPESNENFNKLVDYAAKEGAIVVPICAKVEEDLSALDDEDKIMFREELGIKESGLQKLINACYSLLGLQTFLTCGHDECRAWTFKKGMKAPQCAGIIHTDFERGFIKAEVYSFKDLEKYKTEAAVKENGKYRIEGKEYIMQDGDIVFFKFNV